MSSPVSYYSDLAFLMLHRRRHSLTTEEMRLAVEEYNRLRGQLFVLAEVGVYIDRELENLENHIEQRRRGLNADGVPISFRERVRT